MERSGFTRAGFPAPTQQYAPAAPANDDFLEVIVWLDPVREGAKKRVRVIGWAKQRADGEMQIKLETIPVAGWDGSCVVRPRRDRQEGER